MKQLLKLSGLVGDIGFGILGILLLFSGRPTAVEAEAVSLMRRMTCFNPAAQSR